MRYAFALIRKDPRLIFGNIKDRLIFDWRNGINTTKQVPKDEFATNSVSLPHALHYSSSWTSEIRFGFFATLQHLQAAFDSYTVIDMGCGKGKVPIVWRELLTRSGHEQRVIGIDFYQPLIDAAQANYRKVTRRAGEFLCADAAVIDLSTISDRLIIYMFHPFDGTILHAMLSNLRARSAMVVYNNPENEALLVEHGFTLVAEKRGFHPQATTVVYQRGTVRPD